MTSDGGSQKGELLSPVGDHRGSLTLMDAAERYNGEAQGSVKSGPPMHHDMINAMSIPTPSCTVKAGMPPAATQDALFEVISGDLVDLGEVLVSNKHEFSHCVLRNLTDVPIRVEMSSTVGTLGFQHTNENFRAITDPRSASQPADEARSDSLNDADEHRRGSLPSLLRPDPDDAARPQEARQAAPHACREDDDLLENAGGQPYSPPSHANGKLNHALATPGGGLRNAESPTAERYNYNQVFNYVNLIKMLEIPPRAEGNVIISYRPTVPTCSAGSEAILEYNEAGDIIFNAYTHEGRAQRQKVKFACRCCVSKLEVTPEELDFGTVSMVPNEMNTQIREFTISNNSVIPVNLILRISRDSPALSCTITDYDHGESVLDKEVTLGAHDFKRIQVAVWAKPDVSGDHDMQLRVENLLDQSSHNVTLCCTLGAGTTFLKSLTEVSLPDGASFIDFGNCYAGQSQHRLMTITNVSMHRVLVAFDHDSKDIRDKLKGILSVRVYEPTESGQHSKERTDELCVLNLKPGTTQQLEVCYTPELVYDKRKHNSRKQSDNLQAVRFRLFARTYLPRESDVAELFVQEGPANSRGISCRAQVCTSRVVVREKQIDFGDSLVGATASCHVTIENPTALPAVLRIEYDSRIMKAVTGELLTIKANSVASLEFQIVPHKVNPAFSKGVRLCNVNNPKDESIINLSSNNIDSMSSSHAQYYSIAFFSRRREVDAIPNPDNASVPSTPPVDTDARVKELLHVQQKNGISIDVATGFRVLKTFRLKNKLNSELCLDLKVSRTAWMQLYETDFDAIDDQPASPSTSGVLLTAQHLTALLRAYDELDLKAPQLRREYKEERAFVSQIQRQREGLDRAIAVGALVPLSRVTLAPAGDPGSEKLCYITVLVPSCSTHQQAKRRDEHIAITVANDLSLGKREVPVILQLDASSLEIGQKNLNLGTMIVGEKKSRTIHLSNMNSSLPLLFEVQKDNGFVNATQIKIEGSKDQKYVGLVRPFAKKPLEIVFHPSVIKGKFHGILTFCNVLDPTLTRTMVIKADVTKTATFEVKPTSVDCPPLVLTDPAHVGSRHKDCVKTKVTLINTGKTRREYTVTPSPDTPLVTESGLCMSLEFDVETVKSQASSRDIGEEIEKLEQKVKQYERKGKNHKVAETRKHIAKLKAMLANGHTPAEADYNDDLLSSSDDERVKEKPQDKSSKTDFQTRAVPCGGTISIGIIVYVKRVKSDKPETRAPLNEKVKLDLRVCEAWDKEAQQVIHVCFDVVDDPHTKKPGVVPLWLGSQDPTAKPPVSSSISSPMTPMVKGDDTARLALANARGCSPSASSEAVPPSPPCVPQKGEFQNPSLSTDVEALDFGQLPIGTSCQKSITLRAEEAAAGFVVLQISRVGGSGNDQDARIEIDPKNGNVTPGKPQLVNIALTPLCGKLQKYELSIRNLKDQSIVAVVLTVLGVESAPIRSDPSDLNFKTVCLAMTQPVDRFGARKPERKVMAVTLWNSSAKDLNLKIATTHPAQCAVYHNIDKSEPFQNNELRKLKLKQGMTTKVFVCLYPRLEMSKAIRGICREMRGSVIITSREGNWRKDIPFRCTVGCVVLRIPGPAVAELGVQRKPPDARIPQLKPVRGSFALQNLNKELPLDYQVSVSNDTVLRVDNLEGSIRPSGEVRVNYTLTPRTKGLVQETIIFRNKSSGQSGQKLEIKRTLLLYVDDRLSETSLQLHPLTSEYYLQMPVMPVFPVEDLEREPSSVLLQSVREGSDRFPVTTPGEVELDASTSGALGYAFGIEPTEARKSFVIKNKTPVDLWLVPKCNLHGYDRNGAYVPCFTVSTKPEDLEGSRVVPPKANCRRGVSWTGIGPCFNLRAKSNNQATLYVQPRCIPAFSSLSTEDKQRLTCNKIVTISGYIGLFVEKAMNVGWMSRASISQGVAVQMIKVDLQICLSQVAFECCPRLFLGRVRHSEKVPFNVDVRNASQVRTTFELKCPSNLMWEICSSATCGFPALTGDVGRLKLAKTLLASPQKKVTPSPPIAHTMTPPLQAYTGRCCHTLLNASAEGEWNGNRCIVAVNPNASVQVHCILNPPHRVDNTGLCYELELVNLTNPSNTSKLSVSATVERNIWAFESPHLLTADTPDADGDLCLNSGLKIGTDPAKADATLTLLCTAPLSSDEESITANLEVETAEEVKDFVQLTLLLMATNLMTASVSFSRDELSCGLRIRASNIPGECVSPAVARMLWDLLLDDVREQIEATKEQEIHMQSSTNTWGHPDNSTNQPPRPAGELTYASVNALRDEAKRDPRRIHLGNLFVTSPGHAFCCKRLWGFVAQTPTFEVTGAEKHSLALQEAPKNGKDRVYVGTFKIVNLMVAGATPATPQTHSPAVEGNASGFPRDRSCKESVSSLERSGHSWPGRIQRPLHLRVCPVIRDGFMLRVSISGNPADDGSGFESLQEVTVSVTVPSGTISDEAVRSACLLFFQDVQCPISFQIFSLNFINTTSSDDGRDYLPMCNSNEHLDQISSSDLTPIVDKKAAIRSADRSDTPSFDTQLTDLLSPEVLAGKGDDIAAGYSSPRDTDDPLKDSERQPAALLREPVLKLHNCKADTGSDCRQYTCGLTPGVLDKDPPTVTVLLENTSDKPMEVTADVVHLPAEPMWLITNKTCLVVNPHEKMPLKLTASTAVVGSFSTYIIFEVADHPGELVTLRCSVEILAWGNAASLFEFMLCIDAKQSAPVRPHTYELDVGDVFYNETIIHRCVDVVNMSASRLEFIVSHTAPAATDVSVRVQMSLGLHTFKPFQRFVIHPHQTVRIYFWYTAIATNLDQEHNDTVVEALSEVVLKCRLVKDLAKTIVLKAKCLRPQVSVSSEEFSFAGSVDHFINGAPDQPKTLSVRNLAANKPAMVEVRKGSLAAFTVTPVDPALSLAGSFPIAAGQTQDLRVSLDRNKVESIRKQYARDSFVLEEHFTIYNRDFPKEKKKIVLRCFVGLPPQPRFSSRDLLQPTETYHSLRDNVLLFLRHFKAFAAAVTPQIKLALATKSPKRCRPASQADADDLDQADESDEASEADEGVSEEAIDLIESVFRQAEHSYFEFRWLTDELVYHGLRGKPAPYFVLAKLLYYPVLTHWLLTNPAAEACDAVQLWRGQARYFDTYSSLFGNDLGNIGHYKSDKSWTKRRRFSFSGK
ncbi:RNA 3prime-terminal phosphate cyclase [Diplonema papillatum]|nr:RNA 3prime-terminal phosphate cyclase [Diplonema papillatum]